MKQNQLQINSEHKTVSTHLPHLQMNAQRVRVLGQLKQSPQYKEFHKDSKDLARQARKKMSESEKDKTSESKAEELKQEAGQLEEERFSHALNTDYSSLNRQIKGLEDSYIPLLKNNITTDSKSKRLRGHGGWAFLELA